MAKGILPPAAAAYKVASNHQEAVALGVKFYHGQVCATHGTTVRRLRSDECFDCIADKLRLYHKEYHEANRERHLKRSKDWYEANKARSLENARRWQAENPEERKAISRRWVENNREQHNASGARWQKANPERTCEKTKRWQRANPGQVNAGSSIRRARKRLVVPSWLSAEHRAEIAAFFTRAKREGVTVDHIIPIAGCRCCGAQGLHVPWNMQLLTPAENASKNNRCQDCYDLDRADGIPRAA
jgi:hypothetical protein